MVVTLLENDIMRMKAASLDDDRDEALQLIRELVKRLQIQAAYVPKNAKTFQYLVFFQKTAICQLINEAIRHLKAGQVQHVCGGF